jgi:hypothetical protein
MSVLRQSVDELLKAIEPDELQAALQKINAA